MKALAPLFACPRLAPLFSSLASGRVRLVSRRSLVASCVAVLPASSRSLSGPLLSAFLASRPRPLACSLSAFLLFPLSPPASQRARRDSNPQPSDP